MIGGLIGTGGLFPFHRILCNEALGVLLRLYGAVLKKYYLDKYGKEFRTVLKMSWGIMQNHMYPANFNDYALVRFFKYFSSPSKTIDLRKWF